MRAASAARVMRTPTLPLLWPPASCPTTRTTSVPGVVTSTLTDPVSVPDVVPVVPSTAVPLVTASFVELSAAGTCRSVSVS